MALVRKLTFKKLSARSLQAEKIVKNILQLKNRVSHGYRSVKGWRAYINDIIHDELDEPIVAQVETKDEETGEVKVEDKEFGHTYTVDLDVGCYPKRGRKDEVIEKEWEQVLKVITVTAKTKGWELVDNQPLPEDHLLPGVELKAKKVKKVVEETEEVEA